MAKKSKQQKARESFLVLDEKKLPVVQAHFGVSPELKYPLEFQVIDGMRVNQSALFPVEKKKIIDAIRTRMHKVTSKKFIVRKVNTTHSRIWRVADNTVIKYGGRRKGGPYKKAKNEETKTE
jgi:hypothetical protein